MQGETGFFKKVYDIVAEIPPGKIMTYGQIALELGGLHSGRTVGFAMRAAPAERRLPCHRVINAKGEMSPPHTFGPGRQEKLLRREGVPFLREGRVDVETARWQRDAEKSGKPKENHKKTRIKP